MAVAKTLSIVKDMSKHVTTGLSSGRLSVDIHMCSAVKDCLVIPCNIKVRIH